MLAEMLVAGEENIILGKNNGKQLRVFAAAVLGALVLLVSLLLALPGSAVADGTVKISSDTGSFTAYRMFTGHVVGDRLYDPEFDTQVASADIWQKITGLESPSADAALDWVRSNASSQPSKTANAIGDAFDSSASGVSIAAGEEKVLPDGYYVITGSFKPIPFVVLVGDDSVLDTVAKPTAPSIEKEVVSGQTWETSSVAGVGKPISYRLVGKTSADYAEYESYYFAFHDRADASIAIDAKSVKVSENTSSGSKDITDKAKVSAEGSKLDVEFEDLASVIGEYDPARTIVVEYDAYLVPALAKMGAANPNMNSALIEYGVLDERICTVEKKTQSFTFSLEVTKYGSGKPLGGAIFTISDANGEFLSEDGWSTDETKAITFETGSDGKIGIGGLAGGVYYLTETKAPSGYAKLGAPVKIEVSVSGKPDMVLSAKTEHEKASVVSVDSAKGIVSVSVDNDATSNPSEPGKDEPSKPGEQSQSVPSDNPISQIVSNIVPVLGEHPLAVAGIAVVLVAAVATILLFRKKKEMSSADERKDDDDRE